MIAALLPPAYFALHIRCDEHLCGTSVQQEMVDAYTCVASISIAEIVPEGVDRLVRVQFPERVGPALREEFFISRARLRKKERIIDPALRLICIQLIRDDVVVPR